MNFLGDLIYFLKYLCGTPPKNRAICKNRFSIFFFFFFLEAPQKKNLETKKKKKKVFFLIDMAKKRQKLFLDLISCHSFS